MSDAAHAPQQPAPSSPRLSEIGHLFLSSVRDRQTGGSPPPRRLPPGSPRPTTPARPAVSIDLTAEEFAQMLAGDGTAVVADDGQAMSTAVAVPPLTAFVAPHLGAQQFIRARQYARQVAAETGRVGLIELDAGQLRVSIVELDDGHTIVADEPEGETFDARLVADALRELSCDLKRWLLVVADLRHADATPLLALADRWVLPTTCDHDGVVGCYRTIKGVAGILEPASPSRALAIALINPRDGDEADRVAQKLMGVCKQFLSLPIACDTPIGDVPGEQAVAEHLVISCRTNGAGMSPVCRVLCDLFTPAAAQSAQPEHLPMSKPVVATQPMNEVRPEPAATIAPANAPTDGAEQMVFDVTGCDQTPGAMLSAVVRQEAGGPVECPVCPPMCPDARLAVERSGGLVLLAIARAGLVELRNVGQAYRWLVENRPLIRMALPQMSIDVHAQPRLRLLVEQADASADTLQPLLASESVSVQTYRKLRWGGRTGLLLDAA